MASIARRRLAALVLDGARPYVDVLALQREIHAAVKAGERPDTLVLCQHAPVVTLGKRVDVAREHVRVDAETLRNVHGIDVVETDRGGDATYHGPGQLVVYPMVSLRAAKLGARAYVEGLEDFVTNTLRGAGVKEARGKIPGREGVWVGDAKIAAVGVKISGGVSSHGVAVNVDPNLSHFEHIVPCGLEGFEVTSVVKELGRRVEMVDMETRAVDAFVFEKKTKDDDDDALFFYLRIDARLTKCSYHVVPCTARKHLVLTVQQCFPRVFARARP